MKKQFKIFVAIIMTFVLSVCSLAISEDVQVPVLIDGVRVAFFDQDGNLLQQKKVDDIVYVPLLSLCESMGMEAQVQGQSVAVNGMRIGMFDASGNFLSPLQFDGTDYVPLLAFCEATGVSATEENGKLIIFRAKQEATTPVPQDTKGKVALHPYNFGDYFTYDIRVDEGSFKTVQTRIQVSDGFIYSNDSEVDFVLTCDARSVFEIEDISFDVFGTMYEASAQLSGINSVGFYEDMPASGTLTRTKHETGISITAFKADAPKLQSVTLGDVSGYVILSAEKAEAANEASYQSGIRYLESDNYKAAKAIFAALKQLDYPNSQEKYAEALEVEKIVIAAEKKALEAEKESNYQEALALEDEGSYVQALAMFEELGTYKDCAERILECKEAIDEKTYQTAIQHKKAGEYAKASTVFESLGNFKDSPKQAEFCKNLISLQSNIRSVGPFRNGLARILIDKPYDREIGFQYGYINTDGELAIRFQSATGASDFSEGFASVLSPSEQGQKWGYINESGNYVIPNEYGKTSFFVNGLAVVTKGGKTGVIDKNGKVVIPLEYQDKEIVVTENRDAFFLQKNGKWAYANAKGEIKTGYEFDEIFAPTENMAAVVRKGKYGFINENGELVIPCQYEGFLPFAEGIATVQKGGLCGCINKQGELVIDCQYQYIGAFSNGLASAYMNNLAGYINTMGELVIPYQFDGANSFGDGLATVSKDGKCGFINMQGEMIVPCIYDATSNFINKSAIVVKNGKQGLVDTTGKLILECEYDAFDLYVNDPYILVVKNEKRGLVDKTGTFVFPCEYDTVLYSEGCFTLLKDGALTLLYESDLR